MKLSVVVLTMGNRPDELARAVRSALEQEHADVEVVLVGNGVDPVGDRAGAPPFDDERVKTISLPKNVGIPAGRNRGVEASCGDVVLFLDDDGWYRSTRLGTYLRDRFAADPALGVVSFRVRDPEGGRGERRHVPRLRARDVRVRVVVREDPLVGVAVPRIALGSPLAHPDPVAPAAPVEQEDRAAGRRGGNRKGRNRNCNPDPHCGRER